MSYHNRKWNVKTIESVEEMAEAMTGSCFTLCTGFRCNGILWLNDSFVEAVITEWAIHRDSDGRQIESITVGWQDSRGDEKMIIEYQEEFVADAKPMFREGCLLLPGALDHPEGCELCA